MMWQILCRGNNWKVLWMPPFIILFYTHLSALMSCKIKFPLCNLILCPMKIFLLKIWFFSWNLELVLGAGHWSCMIIFELFWTPLSLIRCFCWCHLEYEIRFGWNSPYHNLTSYMDSSIALFYSRKKKKELPKSCCYFKSPSFQIKLNCFRH